MTDRNVQDMADKLLAEGFQRNGPIAEALNDPIADTPMVVTLDQLRPYDLNPRVTRNPLYDEIKASIRERGLDAPPAMTRRPGEAHYIIRNGGNTRLAILRELWAETKEDRFFRIPCLFRPWPARGELIALTGHLAENELHGGLTFIERALGVEKARELYEREDGGKQLSQAELARRLAADGYPVQQSHISRMQDAVLYLLPAIPTVLYGGLGRHQVERLAVLRKAVERVWEHRALGRRLVMDFAALFQDVLTTFDAQPGEFSPERVRDELVGQMAQLLEADYDTLALEIDGLESRQRALASEPRSPAASPPSAAPSATPPQESPALAPVAAHAIRPETQTPSEPPQPPSARMGQGEANTPTRPSEQVPTSERLQGHIVSPASTTERLQSIQKLVADHTGEPLPDFADNVLRAIPVQAGSLYPISDVWYIEQSLDTPERLRVHIAQFAREIAEEADLANHIVPIEDGIGFACDDDTPAPGTFAHAVLSLLRALSAGYGVSARSIGGDYRASADDLAPLLQGPRRNGPSWTRLSDNGLVKLFRLLRLSRRLVDLEVVVSGDPNS